MKHQEKGIAAIAVLVITCGLFCVPAYSGEQAVQQATVAREIIEKALDVALSAVEDAENNLEAALETEDSAKISQARSDLRRAQRALRRAQRMAARADNDMERTKDAAARAAEADTDREHESALAASRAAAARITALAEQMRKLWLDPDVEYVEIKFPATEPLPTTRETGPVPRGVDTRVWGVARVPVPMPTPTPVGEF